MLINPVIEHLRRYCPLFNQRVAGALEYSAVRDSAKLALPAAYVIATGDDPSDSLAENVILLTVRDEFDVVVLLSTGDERGQSNADGAHHLRAVLNKALVGWKPAAEYEHVRYEGWDLISIDRARTALRFKYAAVWTLDSSDSWAGIDPELDVPFEGYTLELDAIDPADKNLSWPGPDGRIEATIKEDFKYE